MPADPLVCEDLKTLLGPELGEKASTLGWGPLTGAALDPCHPLNEGLGERDRARLTAFVRLCETYWPEQRFRPDRVETTAQAVRFYAGRIETLKERVIWALCLDEHSCVQADVLVQYGGGRTKLPELRDLLRHALLKGASALYVADFRPLEELSFDKATERLFDALASIGDSAGIEVRDYLLLGPNGCRSLVSSRARREAAGEGRMRRVA